MSKGGEKDGLLDRRGDGDVDDLVNGLGEVICRNGERDFVRFDVGD